MELNFDVNTLLDIGLGAVALFYVAKLNKLLVAHEIRITALEKRA